MLEVVRKYSKFNSENKEITVKIQCHHQEKDKKVDWEAIFHIQDL